MVDVARLASIPAACNVRGHGRFINTSDRRKPQLTYWPTTEINLCPMNSGLDVCAVRAEVLHARASRDACYNNIDVARNAQRFTKRIMLFAFIFSAHVSRFLDLLYSNEFFANSNKIKQKCRESYSHTVL